MTKKEFKEKFKVGDKITCDLWEQNDHLQDPCGEIVYIAEDEFCIKDRDGLTVCIFREHIWEHYKKPVKKDLEEFVKCYHIFRVQNESEIWKLEPVMFSKKFAEIMDRNNFITEEEAIERGLKI